MEPYFKGPWRYLPPRRRRWREVLALGAPICLYDLGAAGGMPPPFCYLPEAFQTIQFEPDRRLDTASGGRTLPVAVGPPGLTTLHLNRRPTTSSLLPPNRRITGRYDWRPIFGSPADVFETVDRREVETRGLDEVVDAEGMPPPRFLKVDVQGLSFEVLVSGRRCLAEEVFGVQVEVEFLEAYRGQKSFAAVHELLEGLGFEIFRVANVNPWYYRSELPLRLRTGQHTFCDLLYFRSIDGVGEGGFWNPERAGEALRLLLFFDLTDAAAAYLERFEGAGHLDGASAERYRRLISRWRGALEELYRFAGPWRRLLDASPRAVLRALRRWLRS